MTQKEKILKLFKINNGSFETKDIPYDLAFEARARISDLRNDGYIIQSRKLTRNNWLYKLVLKKDPISEKVHYFDSTGQGELF